MAKVIVAWCDPCMAHEEHTPGNAVQVALDGGKPVEVDLCERHEKEFVAPLRELLGEAGQPVNAEPPAPTSNSGQEKKQCPVCAPEMRMLTREGLRGHLRKIHGYERSAANDVVREMFGNERIQRPFSEPCPECKAEGTLLEEEYTYDTPQGLGAHRKAVHGVDGVNSHPNKPRNAA